MMIDLHTHSILSDGVLLPFELVRRAQSAGLRAIAITDHVDASNIDFVVPRLVKAVAALKGHISIEVIAGAEVTHAPPALIAGLVKEARALGAQIVLVHGETPVEPVAPGTNRAAIESGCDILSHPGHISDEDAALAAERGVALEVTARKGHSMGNVHVVQQAIKHGARLVVNTDAHAPGDLITLEDAKALLLGAGLAPEALDDVMETSEQILQKVTGKNNPD